jgi:NAD+ synthase (glutamine-hydrolysing)
VPDKCQLILFPELCLTGYTCADLFYQSLLLSKAQRALIQVADETAKLDIVAIVGLPVEIGGRLYNCAAFLNGGRILGIVPKTYLPTANEYYEERWFTSANKSNTSAIELSGIQIPFGTDLLFRAKNLSGCVIGVEICEDVWAVAPPSGEQALAGATVLLNPSASDELLGKADYRRELVRQQSARCLAAYLYAGAGPGESTTDVVFSGHSIIVENGVILAETERFQFSSQIAIADIDVERLVHERLRDSTFSSSVPRKTFRTVDFDLPEVTVQSNEEIVLRRSLARLPFVPSDLSQRAAHCREIFAIQSAGLAKRLCHTDTRHALIGVSGGLDSTLALLVTTKAFDILGLPRSGIHAVTMPGFGTTDRTRNNAERLAELLSATLMIVPIQDAVQQHFKDIGHDEGNHDVTYENAQARERTQVLMDLANQNNGLVVGTGDLSELALGWCTYNGDHMSMYNVNAGVPKTLVRYLVEWVAESEFSGEVSKVLHDICATPITPELLPLGEGNALQQMTEKTIGPYELHDFYLFNVIRYQFAPRKVFFLAQQAFGKDYNHAEIVKWLSVFYRRFFSQQFKRSALPDGPKVGSVALSPRGDWRMPSDASSALWIQELDDLSRIDTSENMNTRIY